MLVRMQLARRSLLSAVIALGAGAAVAATPGSAQRTGAEQTRPPVLRDLSPVEFATRFDAAQLLFRQQNWPDAAHALEEVASAYPHHGLLWRQLGIARLRLEDPRGAATAFTMAHQLGLPTEPRVNAADAARAFARIPDAEKAVRWLRIAINELNYWDPDRLQAESGFDAIRDNAPFQTFVAERSAAPAATREERWSADLDFFLREYRRIRSDIPAERFDLIRSSAEELRRRLSALTDDEVLIGMQQLSAMGDRGHNVAPSLFTPVGIGGRELNHLPIDLWMFPEGLYVIGALPPYEDLVGSRITAIGGVPVDEAVRRATTMMDRDRESRAYVTWQAPYYLRISAVLKYFGLSDSLGHADLTLLDARDANRQVRVNARGYRARPKLYHPKQATADEPLYLRRVGESFWFTDLAEGPVYFQYNQVLRRNEGGATSEPIDEFALRLRGHLAQAGKDVLIVDLRHNNGGSTYSYTELLRTLISFDAMPGRTLYVIAGRNTYSAAQNFLVDLDRLTNAIIVGEPTTPPNAGGDQVTVRLPYSGAEMGLSSTLWALQSPQDTRSSIAPQLPATLTAAAYFNGKDPAVDAVLARVKATPRLGHALINH